MRLDFGAPFGAIFQVAYTVPDVEAAMRDYTGRLRIGPWFVRGPFSPPAARFRGSPTSMSVTLARAFSGSVQIELIEQHDDGPSVFHPDPGPRRFGFHHWGTMTRTMDADLERYAGLGCEVAFSDRVPSGARVVYVDATACLPGMIELVEHTEAQERLYARMYRESIGWDGSDPFRTDEALL